MPYDLNGFREDQYDRSGVVEGILTRGDNKTKYSKRNTVLSHLYRHVYPEELAIVFQFANEDEASKFMIKQIDLNPEARSVLPDSPSVETLTEFQIKPERH